MHPVEKTLLYLFFVFPVDAEIYLGVAARRQLFPRLTRSTSRSVEMLLRILWSVVGYSSRPENFTSNRIAEGGRSS